MGGYVLDGHQYVFGYTTRTKYSPFYNTVLDLFGVIRGICANFVVFEMLRQIRDRTDCGWSTGFCPPIGDLLYCIKEIIYLFA